jgi:hypothetical protein
VLPVPFSTLKVLAPVLRNPLSRWRAITLTFDQYRDSRERNAALAGWLDFYNRRRPHGALSHKPPIARLNELNNLLGPYI